MGEVPVFLESSAGVLGRDHAQVYLQANLILYFPLLLPPYWQQNTPLNNAKIESTGRKCLVSNGFLCDRAQNIKEPWITFSCVTDRDSLSKIP